MIFLTQPKLKIEITKKWWDKIKKGNNLSYFIGASNKKLKRDMI
jgi:hypothetical protein